MTYDQLRSAFDRTATLTERSGAHIAGRLQTIGRESIPVSLKPGPLCVMQLVPIAAASGRTGVDVASLVHSGYEPFIGSGWSGISSRLTLDGLVVSPSADQDGTRGYFLVYRSGILEAVAQYGEHHARRVDLSSDAMIRPIDVAQFFLRTAKTFAGAMERWALTGPALLSVAVLRVQGFQLGARSPYFGGAVPVADRPNLILPDIWIDRVEAFPADEIVQPALDVLWQAFGLERCDVFDGAPRESR